MYHHIVHKITIKEDDMFFRATGDYVISLSHETEVILNHRYGFKTYICSLSQGQYDMFMQWLRREGNEAIKIKVMEQIQ